MSITVKELLTELALHYQRNLDAVIIDIGVDDVTGALWINTSDANDFKSSPVFELDNT